jgi:hypothetical protein
MAKERKKQVKKAVAKKAPAKKAVAKKAPAKARAMSSAEIRLKNKQAQLNKKINESKDLLIRIRLKSKGDLDKKIILGKGGGQKKAKTFLNEEANKITKLIKELNEVTLERQIISNGTYKPKTSNLRPLIERQYKAPKKGIRTINSYLAWKRTECIKDLLENEKIYGVKVKSIENLSVETETFEIIDLIDGIFNYMQSDDICIAKLNLATGDVSLQVKLGGNEKIDENEDS